MGIIEGEETTRKGPWTEQEDVQLAFYVNLFGDRRWDFLSKISGLKRSGKSCRLRWVNYLHPGLKHGKMTPHEERLILELHSEWGNRWSRIARKLPGRTDNEIKNYWRTQMRKEARGTNNNNNNKKTKQPNASLQESPSNSSSSSYSGSPEEAPPPQGGGEADDGGAENTMSGVVKEFYSMDEIWKAIDHQSSENEESLGNPAGYHHGGERNTTLGCQVWDYSPDYSVWMMDYYDYQSNEIMLTPTVGEQFYCFDNHDFAHTFS